MSFVYSLMAIIERNVNENLIENQDIDTRSIFYFNPMKYHSSCTPNIQFKLKKEFRVCLQTKWGKLTFFNPKMLANNQYFYTLIKAR